jgi:hypothetical protein
VNTKGVGGATQIMNNDKRVPMRLFNIVTTGGSYMAFWDDVSIDDLHDAITQRPWILIKTVEGENVMLYTWHITAIIPVGGMQSRDIDGLKGNAMAESDAAKDSIDDNGKKIINKKLH